MPRSTRPGRRYCGSRPQAALKRPAAPPRPARPGFSWLRRLLSELLQEIGEFAFGRLLKRIKRLLLSRCRGEISGVSEGHHESVVGRFIARLQLDGALQQIDRFGIALGG